MAKIYQLRNKGWKSKTWYASFRDASGKRVQKSLGVTNKKEAQEILNGIVGDVARLLKVSRQAVIDRIKRGTLEAQKVGEVYVIPKHEAERVKSEKR